MDVVTSFLFFWYCQSKDNMNRIDMLTYFYQLFFLTCSLLKPLSARTSLHSIGKDAKGIYMFVLGTSILEEEMSFEKIGGVKGALVEAGIRIKVDTFFPGIGK